MPDDQAPQREELLLQRHLDGELRPSERAELDRALEKDASMRQRKRRGELQSEFFQADRERDLPPPLTLDFSDRVLTRIGTAPALEEAGSPAASVTGSDRSRQAASEPIQLSRWILAAAILLAMLLVGQFLTRPTPREEMRAGTREADKILRELDRSAQDRASQPPKLVPTGAGTSEVEKR